MVACHSYNESALSEQQNLNWELVDNVVMELWLLFYKHARQLNWAHVQLLVKAITQHQHICFSCFEMCKPHYTVAAGL